MSTQSHIESNRELFFFPWLTFKAARKLLFSTRLVQNGIQAGNESRCFVRQGRFFRCSTPSNFDISWLMVSRYFLMRSFDESWATIDLRLACNGARPLVIQWPRPRCQKEHIFYPLAGIFNFKWINEKRMFSSRYILSDQLSNSVINEIF